jgi:hypothetical protein
MWSEALSMLDRAERLQRQFFHHAAASWEPPADIVETAEHVQVQLALPGMEGRDDRKTEQRHRHDKKPRSVSPWDSDLHLPPNT